MSAYALAWKEERVVVAFVQLFIAHTLFVVCPIGGIAAGYFVGNKIYKKLDDRQWKSAEEKGTIYEHEGRLPMWLGWGIGILIGFAVTLTAFQLCFRIPGVGWRIEQMSEYGDADY